MVSMGATFISMAFSGLGTKLSRYEGLELEVNIFNQGTLKARRICTRTSLQTGQRKEIADRKKPDRYDPSFAYGQICSEGLFVQLFRIRREGLL
jgi:hypothetical protein